jgi:hypothetical protein
VWVSVSGDLVQDAKRDLDDIGATDYEAVRLHDLRTLKVKRGQPLTALPGLDQGILFCTYDLLISGAKTAKKKGGKGGKKGGKGAVLWGKENQPPTDPLGLGLLGGVAGQGMPYNPLMGLPAGGVFGQHGQQGQPSFDQMLAEPGMAGGNNYDLLRQQNGGGWDKEEEEEEHVEEFGESRTFMVMIVTHHEHTAAGAGVADAAGGGKGQCPLVVGVSAWGSTGGRLKVMLGSACCPSPPDTRSLF